MSLNFNNCQIFVGSTGIWCQNASFSSANGSNPISAIGFRSQVSNAFNAPVTNSVSISYYLNTAHEPNLPNLSNIKDYVGVDPLNPVLISFGGVSGAFYLKSYGLTVQPNSLIEANANFQCFNGVSGTLTAKTSDIAYNWFDFANTAYTQIEGGISTVYNLSYNADIDLLPVFSVGSQFPQIYRGNVQERVSVVHDLYTGAKFRPETLLSAINLESITINPLQDTFTNTGVYLALDISQQEVSSFETSIQPNDIIRFSVEANKIS